MKTLIAILVVFCAYLRAADNFDIKAVNTLKDVVTDIGGVVSDVAHKVIPNCVFCVESVSMVLYTKDFPYGKNIGVDEVCDDFDRSKPVFFLVHGFISNANYSNSYKLSEALIKKGITVFSLDWSDAACTTGLPVVKFLAYPSAVQNTREIGEHMASYVISLINKCGVPLNNMTFIGHSLGSHVCGFASKKIQNSNHGLVPLLFGVDPAQPLFMLKGCEDRLCDTDANKTIVLHSSSLGIIFPIGHVDLYFNGGLMQPGCLLDVACSHSRPVLYLADIVNCMDCGFPGNPMSYSVITSPISSISASYPKSDTTDCFVLDHTIFDKNRKFDKLRGKTFYMFVDPNTFCTREKFSCQD